MERIAEAPAVMDRREFVKLGLCLSAALSCWQALNAEDKPIQRPKELSDADLKRLVAQLGVDNFEKRQEASRELDASIDHYHLYHRLVAARTEELQKKVQDMDPEILGRLKPLIERARNRVRPTRYPAFPRSDVASPEGADPRLKAILSAPLSPSLQENAGFDAQQRLVTQNRRDGLLEQGMKECEIIEILDAMVQWERAYRQKRGMPQLEDEIAQKK